MQPQAVLLTALLDALEGAQGLCLSEPTVLETLPKRARGHKWD